MIIFYKNYFRKGWMKMKLGFRDFYYLDVEYVDNLLGFIEGYIEEEVSKLKREESTTQGKAKILGIADASKSSKGGEEFTSKGKITSEIKFKKVIDYLIANDLNQMDVFDDNLWEMLIQEDEMIEVKGVLNFTKIYDLLKDAEFIGNTGTKLGVIDEEEVETVLDMLNKLRAIQDKNGIPIKLNIRDSAHTFVAYLDEKYLLKGKKDIIGNDFKMLCKIERVIPKGKDLELFDLKELDMKYSNREQRRKNKTKEKLPSEFDEVVKGPVAVVLPVAIYR